MTRRSRELPVHTAVLGYLRTVLPDAIVFHPANQGHGRSARQGGVLKAMGVVSGIPDLGVMLPGGRAIWFEVKAPKGRRSDTQFALHLRMESLGHHCATVSSIEEVRNTLRALGIPTREAA